MISEIALVGNPNCGKTTLFNSLTASSQYVGNWPGVTVQKKSCRALDGENTIVDLPGVYSLSPYSIEEIITRDCVLESSTSGIINIVDGINLERNLYLTVQLIELNKPMIIAVNMVDELQAKGVSIDFDLMSEILNVPVIPICAKNNTNVHTLVPLIINQINTRKQTCNIKYNQRTENAINDIILILLEKGLMDTKPILFYASKLLEEDKDIIKRLKLTALEQRKINKVIEKYENGLNDKESMLADARYNYITNNITKVVQTKSRIQKTSISDRIDKVVLNRFLALPIFALIMLVIFLLTFGRVGTILQYIIGYLFSDVICNNLMEILTRLYVAEWTKSLVIDAIIKGIGGVLSFLPQITILFLCLSFLEDTGYMARVAFIMDCMLNKIGLSGKSFIPMIMGFGCTTPAVMSARTMENQRERRMTIILTPFMSCGAKLPIYAVFASVFFTEYKGIIVFSMYIIGIIVAIICGLIIKKVFFRKNTATFVLELPPYRLPSINSILKHLWQRVKGFVIKAGTVIVLMSTIIWFLQSFSLSFEYEFNSENSILCVLSKLISPMFIPLGFNSWEATVSLFTGLIAKESVVSTLSVLLAGEKSLSVALSSIFTPLSAFSFMTFTLLYLPCISALATMKRELNSTKWMLFSVVLQVSVAYIVSMSIYQIGSLFL